MKILRNELSEELNIRTQVDFPIKGMEFIDITPLIIQKKVLEEITEKFVEELKDKNIDYLVLPEARGFLFGTPVAGRIGAGVLPVRKKGKLPPNYIEASFEYEKEYGKDILELPKLVNDGYSGKNFYIIDDLFATGNTIKAIASAIEELGGNVVGYGCVLNIPSLNDDKELFSLIDIEEEIGEWIFVNEDITRPTIMEININNFRYNINEIKKIVGEGVDIMPVIKANAYGTHINTKLDVLNEFNIVAVATVDEGVFLRKIGYQKEIFVLNQPFETEIEKIVANDLVVGISSIDFANKLGEQEKQIKVHVEFGTGMGRTGINPDRAEEYINGLPSNVIV